MRSIYGPLSFRILRGKLSSPKMAAAASMIGKDCQTTTVCVTGATGFVASSLVKRLLEKGYSVHATVRDPENEKKVRPLLDIRGADERLKLFKADLLEEGSFDAAIGLCDGVFHVASPTLAIASNDLENDMIKPAINGTLNVLNACKKAKTVKRVVVTSSVGSVCANGSEELNQYKDESSWSDVDFLRTKKRPGWEYPVSKTLAEKAALQYGKEHDLDVVTIIPVMVVGSAITPDVPFSVQVVLSPLTSNPQMLKHIQMRSGNISLVHVDDLSNAHIFLMENPATQGRYICSTIDISLPQFAHYLSNRYPQYSVPAMLSDMPPIIKSKFSSKKLVESGFSFKFGIDEIIDDAVEDLKRRGLLS